MSRALAAAGAAAALGLAVAGPAPAVTVETPYCVRQAEPSIGVTEVEREQLSKRVLALRLESKAMGRPMDVRVLLPSGYKAAKRHPAKRYPVLYLFHGALGQEEDWLELGDAERIVGDRQMIVVMADGGRASSFSDWYGTVAGEQTTLQNWESFHVDELVPYVDATFPTIAEPSARFIAGLSSGGHGAFKYAAAHPGLYGAAGEFSGAVDTTISYPVYPAASQAVWLVTLDPANAPLAHCTWGDFVAQQVVWRDNNPTYLAENLEGTQLYLTSGDGNPGELDGEGASFDVVEWTTYQMNQGLKIALDAEGLPYTSDFYGAGTHTWPYWKRDLERFLAWLDPKIGQPVEAPATFDVRSAREEFSAWGWHFRTHRDTREFIYLDEVSPSGLTATGSGTLDVTTPAGCQLTIDLGPSHQSQQLVFGDNETAGWTTKHVEIGPCS